MCQQRVFAVQVFELHRLIKVQRLIAGSPHLMVDESAYLGKPSLKSSPAKKLPLEYVVKPPPNMVMHKDDYERASHQLECSAENAVGKTHLPSVKNGNPPSNYGPYIGNPPPAPAPTDSKMGPWCYPQPPGHQWLVPVMSPSEGLVYKPYPGPGFMSTVCGGCGPMGPAPMTVMNHPTISGSAVEQMNRFAGHGSLSQSGQLSGGGASFNMQHQNSCNVPTPKRAIPQGVKFPMSKDSEFQGSTASSPSEREQQVGTGDTAEGRDPLPLFPMAPAAIPAGDPQPNGTDQPTRVIRVVPHNPRSATESAARIFQSIQDERKQLDST
ncbi:Protein early flowering 3 [Vitis vinifera]|uniref:Protein early flowering 3 n=1 Tax=Vitis vinifera TaxID=29760 RepID=A0A438K8M9_VITVI|nr:Protein early flowering 3 [Vitis vinifera]